MGFDLAGIAERFEGAAPLMWHLIQTLLDADTTLQSRRKRARKQAFDYESRHDPQGWSEEAMGGAVSRSGGEIVDEGQSDGEIEDGDESTGHSKEAQLLRIVSNSC